MQLSIILILFQDVVKFYGIITGQSFYIFYAISYNKVILRVLRRNINITQIITLYQYIIYIAVNNWYYFIIYLLVFVSKRD